MGTPAGKIDAAYSREDLEERGLTITNLVATVDFDREFELEALVESLPNSEYEPESTPFVIYRTGVVTLMIPRTGKVSLVGATTVDEIDQAVGSLVQEFDGIGIVADESEPVVENIVVNGDIGEEIVLETAVIGLGMERTEYEPEQFPGLIYRPEDNATLLLFQSGTYVLTGLTSYDDVWRVSTEFDEVMREMGVIGSE